MKEVMPNLDLLTSGAIPPSALALVDSQKMASLTKDFSENYDFVIIDSPPLALAADALILGKITGNILMIARPGVVDSASAASVREQLGRTELNVLGLVVNGVILENEPDSYFHFTKGYYAEEGSVTRKKAALT